MKCKSCKREIPDNSIFCNWCGERQIKERKSEIRVPKATQLPSGTWFIRLRMNGQSVPISEKTEAECIAKAKAIKAGMIEAKKTAPKLTLSKAIDEYIKSRQDTVSPSTVASYRKIQRIRFQSLMKSELKDITPNRIQKAISEEISNGLSAKTIKDTYCFTRTVLSYHGVDLDDTHISLPQVQPSPYKTLTPDEIAVLLKALPGNPCEIPILLALWLGLRRSEIIALEKEDFDFAHNTVTIHSAIVRDENNNYVEKGTKTASSARTIICPTYIMDKVKNLPDGKIHPYDAGYILKCLNKLCKDNNLPMIRLHDLRHINASVMLLLNIPDKYAMERGGWATKQTMTGRYQHTYSAEKIEADKKVNDYFTNLLS